MIDGKKLRKYREEADKTLVELATLTGTTHPFLSDVERGFKQPGFALAARIADALGVTMDSLRKETA